jgi:hypothetical protein
MNQVNKRGMYQKRVYEELKRIVDQFPKRVIKILLGDFNAKVGGWNNSKLASGNESLLQDSKDNGTGIVNFGTSKNLVEKAWQVIRMRERRGVYMVLVWKYNGKELLGRPRRR